MIRALSFTAFLSLLVSAPAAYAQEAATASAEQAFLERTSLEAADDKCGYFTPLERTALKAGQLQARGALLRSGFDREDIDAAAGEVIRFANLQPCGDSEFRTAVDKLKDAFSAFMGQMTMEFPGRERVWSASRSRWDTWRVVQTGSSDDYLYQFGLLAPDVETDNDQPALYVPPEETGPVATPFQLAIDLILDETQAAPSTARLLVRDPRKASEPWLGAIFTDAPGPPPSRLTSVYWPSERVIYEDRNGTRRARFTFGPDATEALSQLDPREWFQLVIQPDARMASAQPSTLDVEIGDFRAAREFTRLPPL